MISIECIQSIWSRWTQALACRAAKAAGLAQEDCAIRTAGDDCRAKKAAAKKLADEVCAEGDAGKACRDKKAAAAKKLTEEVCAEGDAGKACREAKAKTDTRSGPRDLDIDFQKPLLVLLLLITRVSSTLSIFPKMSI